MGLVELKIYLFNNADLNQYDIIFGEGLPLYQACKVKGVKKIYYGTGSYPWHCSINSTLRIKEFEKKYGKLFFNGARLSPIEWSIAATMSDTVVCIGNDKTRESFIENGCESIIKLNPTYYPRKDAEVIFDKRDISSSRKNLLWFGSYGFIHKGLDLCVEAIRHKPDWNLHICGKIENELDIIKAIKMPKNVIIHGFIDVMGDKYKEIASSCLFTILPSVSEGISTSVINCMGNGGMIPIVSSECGIDFNPFKINTKVESIITKLDEIDLISCDQLKKISKESFDFAHKDFTLEQFRENFTRIVGEIV